jgi:chemotaxis protein MotB
MRRRGSVGFGAVALVFLAVGCAHSEQEWQGQVRSNEQLRSRLAAEQVRSKKIQTDGAESVGKLEALEQQLRSAGIDPANLAGSVEQQARATEEWHRRRDQLEAAKRRIELLRTKLGHAAPSVVVTVRNNRLTLQMPGDVLFESGRETLKREGRAMLTTLAEVFRAEPLLSTRSWQVLGHIDVAPQGGRFKDPLALSGARAQEVLGVLLLRTDRGGGGLNPNRWSAAAYGDADPASTKETPEAKQLNQRCEIVMQPAVEETLDLRPLAQP